MFVSGFFLYLAGYKPIIIDLMNNTTDWNELKDKISQAILAVVGTGTIISLGVAIFGTQGQAIHYAVPLAIITLVFGLLLYPFSFLYQMGLPEPLQYFITGLLNLMLIMGVTQFVTGRYI
jgi:hypothetical protein